MVHYIKKDITSKRYISLEEALNPDNYNNIGKTWKDYLDNKFVRLTKYQVEFAEEHPEATVEEIWKKTLLNVRTLEDAKREKISEIDWYDNSEAVNGFTVNNAFTAWFSVQERLNYKQSIESAKLLGVNDLAFFIGDIMLNVSVSNAEMMLAALQLYADQCFIVTKQHKLTVESLETIEEVDEYDYKKGYPEKLNFDLV